MKLDRLFSDPILDEVRPEVRNELARLGRMVEGKSPMEVFSMITAFQRNLESRGLLNPKEKQILSRAIENTLTPDEKRKMMSILSMLKNR